MKKLFFLIFSFYLIFGFAQDTRTFEQINDSILKESHVIYRYDQAFTMTMNAIEADRKLRKEAGEILVMPKKDTLYSLVFDQKNPELIIAQMKFGFDSNDSATLAISKRAITEEELNFHQLKHRVMNTVQANYTVVNDSKDTYKNPIFIPFKEKFGSKEIQLYKLYLITETTQSNTIPFGQDYLFMAKSDGSVFYNLQFNPYMPLPISYEMVEATYAEIEYPEREPYITPTDIYLFNKYGATRGLNTLDVFSNAYGIIFRYDWDRDELNVLMPEPEDTEERVENNLDDKN